MDKPLIRLQAIRKSYTLGKVDLTALHEGTLAIDAGEFVALSGASGSGKMTLRISSDAWTSPVLEQSSWRASM